MGIRIKLPGIFLVVIGVLGIALLLFFRPEWTLTEVGVLAAVAVVGAVRTLRGA